MNQFRPYINRFVKQKQMQITDEYHNINMKDMKPITAKLMQHTETITINRSKREQIREVRDIQIQRENKILLNKIEEVISKKGKYSVVKTKTNKTRASSSLNQTFRKQQMESIERQNQQLFQRLHGKKATVDNSKLQKDWQQKKKIIKKMANYQFNVTHFKEKEIRTIQTERILLPLLGNIKLSRVKVMNGRKILIKVQVNDDYVKIIGDFCDSKDLKIIQIPKEEAITIIQSKCQGKIQNIIDRLQYDQQGQTLHLTISASQQKIKPQKIKIQTKQKINRHNSIKTHRTNKSNLDKIAQTTRQNFNQTGSKIKIVKNQTSRAIKLNDLNLLSIDANIHKEQQQNYQEQKFEELLPQAKTKEAIAKKTEEQKNQENYDEDFQQTQPANKQKQEK